MQGACRSMSARSTMVPIRGPLKRLRGVMVVTIGRISAMCPVCQGTEFLCAVKEPTAFEIMTCANCKLIVTYAFLTEQVAKKAIADSKASRDESERKRRKD